MRKLTNFTHGHRASKTYEAFDRDGNGTNEPAGVVRYAYTSGDRLARRTWARGEITNYIYHPSTGDLLYTDYGTNTDTRDLAYTYDRLGPGDEGYGGHAERVSFLRGDKPHGQWHGIHARIHCLRPAEPATTHALVDDDDPAVELHAIAAGFVRRLLHSDECPLLLHGG